MNILYAIAALAAFLFLMYTIYDWRPWSRATLFDGFIKIQYYSWDHGGPFGKKIVFDFIRSGVYTITLSSPTCIECEKNTQTHTFKILENCMVKEIELSMPYPEYFEVTVTRNGSEPQTCKIYGF